MVEFFLFGLVTIGAIIVKNMLVINAHGSLRGAAMEIELLTVSEVARLLGLSPDGVRLLEREGKLPAHIKVGKGQRLFDRATVEKLKRKRRSKAGSKAA